MLVNKITTGFVIQVFDTETGRFVSQEFVAGDDCQYEDKEGNAVDSHLLKVDGQEAYLPFDMVQPKSPPAEARTDEEPSGFPETSQPAVPVTIMVERLASKADSAGLQPEELDETVHELASSVAADINNGGLEDQIRYLVEELGAQHAEKQLDELIEEHAKRPEEGE